MPSQTALIIAWARSAVAPHGGAFSKLVAHEIASPVVRSLLNRAGLQARSVDALIAGNALAAGGNPARLVALAAGLGDCCPGISIDSQCCAGLDAIAVGASLVESGQAPVVIAGGVEAWTRSPLRAHRPLGQGERASPFERPSFSPDPGRDPDMLEAAARHAARCGHSRELQDLYAIESHRRAVCAAELLATEIVPVAGLVADAYPRPFTTERASRLPHLAVDATADSTGNCALSPLALSPKADGAAFVALAGQDACRRLSLTPLARWVGIARVGSDPSMPLVAAQEATAGLLSKFRQECSRAPDAIELHDAFATQGLAFADRFDMDRASINRLGGGIARGHPIGASGAIALVRVLSDLQRSARRSSTGLATIAAAGGLGIAALVATV